VGTKRGTRTRNYHGDVHWCCTMSRTVTVRRCDGIKPPRRCIRKQPLAGQAKPSLPSFLLAFLPSLASLLAFTPPPSQLSTCPLTSPRPLPSLLAHLHHLSSPPVSATPCSVLGILLRGIPATGNPLPPPGFADANVHLLARHARRFEIKLPVGRRIRNKPMSMGHSS
jgi:hypothetical protein